jgi:putative transposase
VDYKDRKAVCKDLRTVYTAGNEQEARMALDDFADSWKKYPHIVKSWLGDWTELMAFMDYGPEMRRLMYTTNALEGTALRAPFGSKASLYYYLYI